MKFLSTLVSLTFLSPVIAKINIAAPVNAVPGGPYTVIWTHDASDPSEFILMIQLNTHTWATGQFWEFTQTTDGKLDLIFENESPNNTPGGLFRLQARNQSNVDQIYSESEQFRFLAAGSTTSAPPPSVSASGVSSVATTPGVISSASGATSRFATSSGVGLSSSASTRSSGASSSRAGASQTATPSQSPAEGTTGASSDDDQIEEGAAMALTGAASSWSAIAVFASVSWVLV